MGKLLVDPRGIPVPAPGGTVVGRREVVPVPARLVWASMSQRYHPSHPPGESCLFGMDFSFVVPSDAWVASAFLQIFNNTFLSPDVSADWSIGAMVVSRRRVWTRLSGGVEGVDYQLRWTVADSDGSLWPRTALVLCSQTG